MNQKLQSQAIAIGGFLGVVHAVFIEPNTFGICFAGFYTIIGFWSWISIENSQKEQIPKSEEKK